MSKRRAQVFRLARKLMAGRSSDPSWYWRNFSRLHRALNGESPIQTELNPNFAASKMDPVRQSRCTTGDMAGSFPVDPLNDPENPRYGSADEARVVAKARVESRCGNGAANSLSGGVETERRALGHATELPQPPLGCGECAGASQVGQQVANHEATRGSSAPPAQPLSVHVWDEINRRFFGL